MDISYRRSNIRFKWLLWDSELGRRIIMRCFSEWRTIPDKQRKIYLAGWDSNPRADLRSNLSKCYMLLSFVPDVLRDFYGNFIPYTTRPEFNHQKKYHTKFVNNVWEQRCNNDAWFHQAATSCCHCLVAICCANETFKQFSDLRNSERNCIAAWNLERRPVVRDCEM